MIKINTFKQTILLSTVLLGLVTYNFIGAQWAEPTGAPPTGNVSAPLNLSAAYQAKLGDLGAVKMRSGEYCDASGTICTKPQPVCTSGQILIANGTGGWTCGAFPTTVVARFNTKYVGLIFDPNFQAWLGANSLPTRGLGRNLGSTVVYSPDLGWYIRSTSLSSTKWKLTIDKLCSFMMVNGTAFTAVAGYFRGEDYGSDNANQALSWSGTAWVNEPHGDNGAIDITELTCSGTAISTAGNKWLTFNLTYATTGDVRINPFWNTSYAWINN